MNSFNSSENSTETLTQNQFFDNPDFYTKEFFSSEVFKKIMDYKPPFTDQEINSLAADGINVKEIDGKQFIDADSVSKITQIVYIQQLELKDLRATVKELKETIAKVGE